MASGDAIPQPPTLNDLLDKLHITLPDLNQLCSYEHLTEISLFLDWRGVAPHLGLNDTAINQIESKKTESEKCLETLQMWKRKYGYKASFKMLVDALLKISNAEQAENVCQILQQQMHEVSGLDTSDILTLTQNQPVSSEFPGEIHENHDQASALSENETNTSTSGDCMPQKYAPVQLQFTTSQCRGLNLKLSLTLPFVQEEHKDASSKLQNPTTAKSRDNFSLSQHLHTPNYFKKPYDDSGVCCCSYSGLCIPDDYRLIQDQPVSSEFPGETHENLRCHDQASALSENETNTSTSGDCMPQKYAPVQLQFTTSQCCGLKLKLSLTLPFVQEEHKDASTKLQNPTTAKSRDDFSLSQHLHTPNYFKKPYDDSGVCCCSYSGLCIPDDYRLIQDQPVSHASSGVLLHQHLGNEDQVASAPSESETSAGDIQQECAQSHKQQCSVITSQCQRLNSEPNVSLPPVQEETSTKLQISATAKTDYKNLTLSTPNFCRKPWDSGVGCSSTGYGLHISDDQGLTQDQPVFSEVSDVSLHHQELTQRVQKLETELRNACRHIKTLKEDCQQLRQLLEHNSEPKVMKSKSHRKSKLKAWRWAAYTDAVDPNFNPVDVNEFKTGDPEETDYEYLQ